MRIQINHSREGERRIQVGQGDGKQDMLSVWIRTRAA